MSKRASNDDTGGTRRISSVKYWRIHETLVETENGETFYEAKGSIKLDPATLGDGRVVDKTSCGGRI